MSASGQARRGRPLGFAMALMLAWGAVRVIAIDLPMPSGEIDETSSTGSTRIIAAASPAATQAATRAPVVQRRHAPVASEASLIAPEPRLTRLPEPVLPSEDPFARGRVAVGHNMGWMAAMAAVPLVGEVDAWLVERGALRSAGRTLPASSERQISAEDRSGPAEPQVAAPKSRHFSRWHADGWVLFRDGGLSRPQGGVAAPVLGSSQAGLVLSYRLAPSSRSEPSAYLRSTLALHSAPAPEVAMGVRARPLAGLPVTAHAELRVDRGAGDVRVRPAAFLTAGVDDHPVAGGVSLSGYAQAGYVAGRDASAFVDGRLVADRELASFSLGKLRSGVGLWGGAQKGASRLDIGPSAQVRTELAGAPVRLTADFRLRVAGAAEPVSGAAVTLSTGF